MSHRSIVACVLLSLVCSPLFAVTYLVPRDEDLVERADAILVVRAIESHSELNDKGGIVTVSRLTIESVMKGPHQLGGEVRVTELGGTFGNITVALSGRPDYRPGHTYLVFLTDGGDGRTWSTWGLDLGRFVFRRDLRGTDFLMRGNGFDDLYGFSENTWTAHVEPLRLAEPFMAFIRDRVRGHVPRADNAYVADRSAELFARFSDERNWLREVNAARTEYMFVSTARWQTPRSVRFDYQGVQPGLNGPNALNAAVSMWNNVGTALTYTAGNDTGGSLTQAQLSAPGAFDGVNAVLFNDPFDEVPSGIAGRGGPAFQSDPYQIGDGINYLPIFEGNVVINNGVSFPQDIFTAVLTHELGHTMNFRHSNESCTASVPCTGDALMNSIISVTSLRQWDRDAIQTVYGTGPTCTPPAVQSINANPFSVNAGQSSTLTVTATGTTPQTFQWFIGNPGNFSQPIAGATGSSVQVTPTTTTNYFVQVTGCSQAVNSLAVQVQVVSACPAVSVTASSQSTAGGFSLTANATGGSGFNFQWFVGSSSGPSAGTGQTIAVNPSSTTTYVVRATNSCGNVGEGVVNVTVSGGCPAVVANLPVVNALGTTGRFTLTAGASGGSNIQFNWFTGTPPNGNFIESNQTITVMPNMSTSYFFVATNSCGNMATSAAVVVTPMLNCVAPQIASVAANPTSITSGQPSALSVNATGSSLVFQWYIGSPGNFTQPIAGANSATVQVSPMATTTYFVQVTSGCGAGNLNSAPVTVTVTPVNQCLPPAVTAQPASTSVTLGFSTTLSVAASGTGPLAYQWFVGQPGDTTQPISGATGTSLSVQPNTQTAYWVRITGQCGSPVNSNGATVSVTLARKRAVRR